MFHSTALPAFYNRTGITKVFTTPLSNRMRAMMLIAENVGFDSRHMTPTAEFETMAEEYTVLVQALRENYPMGVLYDKGQDRNITRILFPNVVTITQAQNQNFIASLQNGRGFGANAREANDVMANWSKVIESEFKNLRNALSFYTTGPNIVEGDNLLMGLTDTDHFDVVNRVTLLHEGFKTIVDQMRTPNDFQVNERIMLDRVDQHGAPRVPIKEVTAMFYGVTTLSLLRFFLTRLWILEYFTEQTEE